MHECKTRIYHFIWVNNDTGKSPSRKMKQNFPRVKRILGKFGDAPQKQADVGCGEACEVSAERHNAQDSLTDDDDDDGLQGLPSPTHPGRVGVAVPDTRASSPLLRRLRALKSGEDNGLDRT